MMHNHSGLEVLTEILGNDYLKIYPNKLSVSEDPKEEKSKVSFSYSIGHKDKCYSFLSEGSGVVDALFSGYVKNLSKEYKSLETIELLGFSIKIRDNTGVSSLGTDAQATVEVGVKNGYGQKVYFECVSRSILSGCSRVSSDIIEFFINSERAFIKLFKSVEDAQDRNRQDLIEKYKTQLSEVVRFTNYELLKNESKSGTI